jgi:hypothetical protein
LTVDHIRVLLEGGPTDLPESIRLHEVVSIAESVKVVRGSGYEHFRYSGQSRDVNGIRLPVFQWCDRTRIAE